MTELNDACICIRSLRGSMSSGIVAEPKESSQCPRAGTQKSSVRAFVTIQT